jgi:type II secretory pathway component GspD/PulD (secretin)
VLPKARELVITETGGRLREIRDVLKKADSSRDPTEQEIRWFELKSVSPEEAVMLLRQMFEMPEDSNALPDGSLRLASDPVGLRLLVSGSPARMKQVTQLLKTIDQTPYGEQGEAEAQGAMQLEVYDVAPADPESVLKVMQTLLADIPGVRVATDPKTGNLLVLGRAKEQATARATVDQMRRDAQTVEVIQLHTVDPQLAVLGIGKLFGTEADKSLSVDADVVNRQLLIRGSAGQISQIRLLLQKMGEPAEGSGARLGQGKIRVIPVRDAEARELIGRLRELWSVVGANELRVVPMRGGRPGAEGERPGFIDERTPVPPKPSKEPADAPARPTHLRESQPAKMPEGRLASVRLAATQVEKPATEAVTPAEGAPTAPQTTPAPVKETRTESGEKSGKPPIFLFAGPDGLYLSSEDLGALDQLQGLINKMQGAPASDGPKLTVFYLRNAEAKAVAERLNELLASATPVTSTDNNRGGRNDNSNASGGILGNLGSVGTAGHITTSAPVSITPDTRLNALFVQAAPADVEMIEQVLKILDRRDTPEEIPAHSKPRLIPVLHTSASEIATVVKEVYQNRMVGSGGNNNRNMDPRAMMMQMWRGRGGRDRGRSGNNSSGQQDASQMTVSVDERTNSLIVSAPEKLFEEVRELVFALDRVASEDNEMVEVISLRQSNADAVRQALSELLGDAVESGTTSISGNRSGSNRGSSTWNRGSSRWGGFGGWSRGGGGNRGGRSSDRSRGGSSRGGRSTRGERGGR